MIITYTGGQCFKIQVGDLVVATNPISKESKLKPAKFGADIALITLNHPDFNGIEQITFGEKKPFAITGPGEYEIHSTFVRGFKSSSKYGDSDQKINTIYYLSLDGMKLCFLGALDDFSSVDAEAKEALEEIDILFMPVTSGKDSGKNSGTLDVSSAAKLAVQLEPKLIIPMYDETSTLKSFLKETGKEKVDAVDKLTIKRKDIEGKTGEVVVLSIA